MSTGKGDLRTVLARLPSKCDGVLLFACARKTREMLGTDSAHKKGRELLCQKYRIGPKDDKLPILLPVSETAQPRLDQRSADTPALYGQSGARASTPLGPR